jgi:hypothetical protein
VAFKIVTADERMARQKGLKIVIPGPHGIGKTSLLRSVAPYVPLFLNAEAGDLAVQDVDVAEIAPDAGHRWSWPELRNVAAVLGGPNDALGSDRCYSRAHYDAVVGSMPGLDLSGFNLLFVDSVTVITRACFAWCQTQPDAFSPKTGAPDIRGAYGLLAREMVAWLEQLQHARSWHVVLLCLLDPGVDAYGRPSWDLQMDGKATPTAMLGIVDIIATLNNVMFAEPAPGGVGTVDKPVRCLVTQQGNPYGFPAKDRSGRLDPIEPPNLGALIAKASDAKRVRGAMAHAIGDGSPAPLNLQTAA